jgi:hypothetical protein
MFCIQGQKAKSSPGKNIAAQVLPDLQGKGPVRQRSLSAESALVTLARQSNSLRGN